MEHCRRPCLLVSWLSVDRVQSIVVVELVVVLFIGIVVVGDVELIVVVVEARRRCTYWYRSCGGRANRCSRGTRRRAAYWYRGCGGRRGRSYSHSVDVVVVVVDLIVVVELVVSAAIVGIVVVVERSVVDVVVPPQGNCAKAYPVVHLHPTFSRLRCRFHCLEHFLGSGRSVWHPKNYSGALMLLLESFSKSTLELQLIVLPPGLPSAPPPRSGFELSCIKTPTVFPVIVSHSVILWPSRLMVWIQIPSELFVIVGLSEIKGSAAVSCTPDCSVKTSPIKVLLDQMCFQ